MKDWKWIKLGDSATFVNGYPFKPTEWTDDGLEIIRIQNLTEGSFQTNFFGGKINEKYKVTKGDILISWSATLGVYEWQKDDAWLNQHIFKVIFNKTEWDKLFFKYLIKSILDFMGSQVHGATMKHITKKKFDEIQIPLPPLEKQKRIAAILDAADLHRQKTKSLLDKYDELAQALFLDMFGDPVTNPKGWEVKSLKSLSTKIHSGNTPKGGSNVYVESGIIFFRSQNVWKNNLIYEDIAYIDQEIHNKMAKSSLKHGDLLMTKTGRFNTENSSLGRAAIYLGNDDMANVNGHVYLIRLKKGQVNKFILHILTSIQFRDLIRRVCVGGIDKRQLNKNHIEDFPIITPPKILQEKFITQFELIENQKSQAEQNLQKAEELFQSLLQKAFKGEL